MNTKKTEKPVKQNIYTFTDDEFGQFIVRLFIAVWVFAIGAVVVYVWWFRRSPISDDPGSWGAFGDYVGGLINPAVGLATVLLVVISITIQRKEMRASLIELKAANEAAQKSSFEQSLFAWLDNYHAQVAAIGVESASGRKALQRIYDAFMSPRTLFGETAPSIDEANQHLLRLDVSGPLGVKQLAPSVLMAVIGYQRAYGEHRADLDAPLRTLYRLFRWIDNSAWTPREKWHYCALVRSQLSWAELVVLYYNGLTVTGEKLAPYANKYALFDNLDGPGDHLIHFAIERITPLPQGQRPRLRDGNAPWTYEPTAFDSAKAKNALGIPLDA